jgi:5'-3' exonuclease
MQLHLVDATYELFRHFYAVPSRKAPDGREVGATLGLASSMLSLLRGEGVTHVGCATDHVIRSYRNDLWAGYKTEAGVPPELLGQFELAEEMLRALGLVVWPMVELEADDALATAVKKYGPRFEKTVVCTVDKDLAQMVDGQRVVMWDRRREKVYDEAGVLEKFGVPPAAIPDLLALVGDTADGYPGIDGWGEKSAAAVLQTYGRLEAIPAAVEAWTCKVRGAPRLCANLAARSKEAALFKLLATLRTDAPLQETVEELEWRGARRGPLEALCGRLGLEKLASRPHRWRDE